MGIYLFVTTDRASFLTWQAVVYFIVGSFLASIFIGGVVYVVQRGIAKAMMMVLAGPSAGAAVVIFAIGLLLLAAEVAVIYAPASWTLNSLLFAT